MTGAVTSRYPGPAFGLQDLQPSFQLAEPTARRDGGLGNGFCLKGSVFFHIYVPKDKEFYLSLLV